MPSFGPALFLFLTLAAVQLASAQMIVNSVFTPNHPGYYGDVNNWSPPEVPNNSPEKIYNVTIPGFVRMDVDATISDLMMTGTYLAEDHSLTVLGSTTANDFHIFIASSLPAGTTFAAGSLSSFSGGSLRGHYSVMNNNTNAGWATLQFNGAHVTALSNSHVYFGGPMTRIVDESGNAALRDLAHIDGGSSLGLVGHHLTVPGPLTNDGQLSIASGLNQPSLFRILGPLTNFDSASQTLTGGTYHVGGSSTESNQPTVFQFAGADIVHNATILGISGPLAKITDENGNDALRNFAHNTLTGEFSVSGRDFSIAGDFTNDGVMIIGPGTLAIEGSLTNFDPTARTLTGGTYRVSGQGGYPARFVFHGADIVNNASTIGLSGNAEILDENGNSALRNFAHNLPAGVFTVGSYKDFILATDFTNEGTVNIIGDPPMNIAQRHFKLTGGHTYHQTGGTTYFAYAVFSGDMVVDGGSFSTAGFNAFIVQPSYLEGNLTVNGGVFAPDALIVNGAVHLSSNSVFQAIPQNWSSGYFSVTDTFTAGGTLQIADPGAPSSTATFLVVNADNGVTGTFNNAPHGSRIPTIDGGGSFIVSYTPNSISLSGFQPILATGQLLNISTRARVGTGEDVLIGGFIITGTQPKRIIVRAIGPSLSSLPGTLADPVLELRDSSGNLIASNDNWRSDQQASVIATGIPPGNDLESAIVATLPAQNSAYTAIVRGVNNGTGVGLVEVYDLAPILDSKPANISTRGLVQTGDNVLIGGLMILGQNPLSVIARAMGPSLPMPGTLADPTLSLHDSNGALIAFNDNWRSDQEEEIIATGISPNNNLESAIVATLPANGAFYTAIVQGQDGASGIGLIEFYALNP